MTGWDARDPGDLPVPGEDDLGALAETDALLDLLAARRTDLVDLTDPAVAALALLAADVDREPAPPMPAARPTRGPRTLRLRAFAVAAGAAVALYGGLAAAAGSWTPWPSGTGTVEAQDDAQQLRVLLTTGLTAVRDDDLASAQRQLQAATQLLQEADLTPEEQAQVEQLVAQLARQLADRGVVLTPDLLPPGLALPSPADTATGTADGSASDDDGGAPEASDPATGTPTDPGTGTAEPGQGGGAKPSDPGRPADPGRPTDTATTPQPEPTTTQPSTGPSTNPGGQTGRPSKTSRSPKPSKTSKPPKSPDAEPPAAGKP